MALAPMPTLLRSATKNGYAFGYFESWDQYSLEAVVEAVEELESPIVIGFGGMTVNQTWFVRTGLEELIALGGFTADNASVTVSLLLNEVESFALAMRGMKCGFNAVLLQTSQFPFRQIIAAIQEILKVAHTISIAVKAELGRLSDA
jgi:fructose/tagatose bisphosphate aldolase